MNIPIYPLAQTHYDIQKVYPDGSAKHYTAYPKAHGLPCAKNNADHTQAHADAAGRAETFRVMDKGETLYTTAPHPGRTLYDFFLSLDIRKNQ